MTIPLKQIMLMKLLRRFALGLILLLFYFPLLRSQTSVTGKILDTDNQPASFATVSLCRLKDSVIIKNELADEAGKFSITNVANGEYFLKIKSIANGTKYTNSFTCMGSEIKLPDIKIEMIGKNLEEVVVSSTKPVYEHKTDRIVYNLENSLESPAADMLEVLQKAPLVNVDANGNISLKGKHGVMVMINGKPTYLGAMELNNLLRSTTAGQVSKIELITTPPAKYDAAGNAGIINIIMKKNQKEGFNGNLSLSAAQSVYPRTNEGLGLNYRKGNINIYGNYNFAYHEFYNDLTLIRRFYKQGVYIGAYNQKNYLVYHMKLNNLRLGVDYNLGSKTIIGIATSLSRTHFDKIGFNTSNVYDSTASKVSYFTTANTSDDSRKNGSVNINLKHTIDTTGKEISMDLDYAEYSNKTFQNFTTNYYNLDNQLIQSPYLLYGDLQGRLNIKSIKIDYAHPVNKSLNLEAGVKASEVNNNNNVMFFDQSDGQNNYDSTKSNHFIYSENINALYVNTNSTIGAYSIQFGLRAEQTIAKGNQLVSGESFERNYIQLFPSLFITRKMNKNNDLGLSISRRIDRPSYEQLNPFKYFLDPSTYSVGNPFLLPQLTYDFVLTHTYKQEVSTSIEYNVTTDNITDVLIPEIGTEKVTIQTNKNIAKYQYYGINTTIPLHPYKWWNSTNTIYAYYSYYSGDLQGTSLRDGAPTFSFDSYNSFIFKNNWNAELNFNYKAREVYGFMTVEPSWMLSTAVQKQFWNKRATVRLNVNDIFFTGKIKALSVFTDYRENFLVKRSTQIASIAFTFRFGKNTVPPNRKRTTGVEDEKKRVNTGGG